MRTHQVVFFMLIAIGAIAFQPCLYGQDFLPKERENEIKMSGKYYWGEGSDFIEEQAKYSASKDLSNQIIQDAVGQMERLNEMLKTIETGVHLDRLPQQGKIKILAWIAKDSVLLTVATQRPITKPKTSQPISSTSIVQPKEEITPQPEHVPMPVLNPAKTENPVLQELAACKTYNDVMRVAKTKGLVRGEFGGGSKGFSNPENCIIAVFTADGKLTALLDIGDNSRTDVLSGNIIQNPEQYYKSEVYYLWYMQQKVIN